MRLLNTALLLAIAAVIFTPSVHIQVVHAQDDPEPTLPEVVVEPGDDEETLPPIDVTPDDDFSDLDPTDDGRSAVFPSLSDLRIGGLDGGSRGGTLSLFDSPRAVDIVTQQRIT